MPRLTGTCVGRVRLELSEQGFTLVKTPRFFREGLFLRLKRRRMVLPFHCNRWRKHPQLARYGCWLESLLHPALPEEAVSLAALEYRHEPAGFLDPKVDRLHADGSYIRSVFTLCGLATVYRDEDTEKSVPAGQTLLMTALARARAIGVPCTLHRRPEAGPERAVIVGSFEPRPEDPHLANVYRQATHAHRSRTVR
jgi:hypothetical protein